jgi:hypothetical protein
MKLETINIILAVIVVGLLLYIAMTHKGGENFKYNANKCQAITQKYNKYLRDTNSVYGNPAMLSEMMSVCGTGYNQALGGPKAVPKWARKLGGTHHANITDIFNGLMYQ